MFWGISEGDRVIARRRIHTGLFNLGAEVRRGAHGIVRSAPAGLLARGMTVEFDGGHTTHVSARDVRRAVFGHGQQAWEKRQATRQGIKLGMALLWLPALVALGRYFLAGGSVSSLIAAAPAMALATLLQALTIVLGLGLGPLLMVMAVLVVLNRRRGRRGGVRVSRR